MDMENLSDITIENRKISARRIKKGKIESIVYPVLFFVFACVCAVLAKKLSFALLAFPLALCLIMGWNIGRQLYVWGNIPYGLYVFYYVTSVLPYKQPAGYLTVLLLLFTFYIAFSAVRTFSSEAIKAYLYDKNSD